MKLCPPYKTTSPRSSDNLPKIPGYLCGDGKVPAGHPSMFALQKLRNSVDTSTGAASIAGTASRDGRAAEEPSRQVHPCNHSKRVLSMGTDNVVFLEILEWFDETGGEIVHRIPESGSGEIKYGAQLIVRKSQAAVFFYGGRAYEAFGPGRHTLTTGNIPLLTKVLSLPWGFSSPLRAEVYFVNRKVFTNLKWGTRDPVAFKDSELGLVRLRAFGVFNLQIVQPILFINSLVGTQGVYTTREVEEYLNRVIVSRFNDYLGGEPRVALRTARQVRRTFRRASRQDRR